MVDGRRPRIRRVAGAPDVAARRRAAGQRWLARHRAQRPTETSQSAATAEDRLSDVDGASGLRPAK